MKKMMTLAVMATLGVCQPALAQFPSLSLPQATQAPAVQCADCGTVQGINQIQKEGESSGVVGAVGGGLIGGLLGNQIGGGSGRDLATIGGAVGGAYVGSQVEKKMAKKTVYEAVVRFDDGRTQVFNYDNNPGWQAGQRVRLVNGGLQTLY
ncbi:MAG: glycine zipper 2TM domain-containing protein [Rhodocyclaceae bacterium]|nr:glycine zipper 2TM domain-containing protein [Rhodocyclaceae bacterium]